MDDKLKSCKECGGEFPIETFPLDRGRPRPRCRNCFLKTKRAGGIRCRNQNLQKHLEYEAAYRKNNSESIKLNRERWESKNPNKYKEYQEKYKNKLSEEDKRKKNQVSKQWKRDNPERVLASQRDRLRKRRKTDVSFRILKRIRSSIRTFLKELRKKSRSLSYTGCSSPFHFLEEMNKKTNNPNWLDEKYQLDHIWQIHWFSEYCAANFEDVEGLALIINHHSNLRPLTKELNQNRSRFDFSFVTDESFSIMKKYLNKEISNKISLFLKNRDLFSGDMIMKTSPEERLILSFSFGD